MRFTVISVPSKAWILVASVDRLEVPHLIPPGKPTLREAMAQENRRTISQLHIVDPHARLKNRGTFL